MMERRAARMSERVKRINIQSGGELETYLNLSAELPAAVAGGVEVFINLWPKLCPVFALLNEKQSLAGWHSVLSTR